MARDRLASRRKFLQTGAAALAGAALMPTPTCSPQSKKQNDQNKKFVYRTLGKTGLRLPVVSMGSCYAINLVQTALDEGMVYIHTSSEYSENNHERLLGEVFRKRPRETFVVGTSPGLPYEYEKHRGRSVGLGTGVDPSLILESIDGSLGRLKVEYVDIYYLASVSRRETVLHEPYITAFEKLKEAGKTRFVGVITHENEPEVIRAATDSGFWDVVITAYNFRQSHRKAVEAAISRAAGAGLGIVAMKTQAGVYWDRARARKINMKAALKWALRNENVHTSVPAFSNYEEMREDLEVMSDPTLTEDDVRDLQLGDELGLSGHYCQQCARCLAQCPAGVDVPTLMRSHMYAFAHGSPRKAFDTLRSWTPRDVACRTCSRCEVECTLGFDVKSRALDVARILDVPGEFLG